jgi:UDP-MurNAc hydroxylase
LADITFLNHASVVLSQGDRHLLTDPWHFGAVFHEGWQLLSECAPDRLAPVIDGITDIWLSHEHPDHFHPPFFRRYLEVLKRNKVRIFFQKTRDRRVAGFLKGLGLPVVEMAEGEVHALAPDFSFRMIKADFYDSALMVEMGGLKVFNLNDCHFTDRASLTRIRRTYGTCDVLLTQFSYAAWKGGPENRAWRAEAAKAKLDGIRLQAELLEPKAVLPFASYVRFANALNLYLNDAINTPQDVIRADPAPGAALVFLAPFERQDLSRLAQTPTSLAFWDDIYRNLPRAPAITYPPGPAPAELASQFAAYRARMFRQNAGWLIRLIGRTGLMGGFQPLTIRLIDQSVTLRLNLATGAFGPTSDAPDIDMHSASLAFVFANDFGFDTLAVNGCFREMRPGGFVRMAKVLALGNLNSMGMRLGPGLIFNLQFVGIFLSKVSAIARRLRQPAAP